MTSKETLLTATKRMKRVIQDVHKGGPGFVTYLANRYPIDLFKLWCEQIDAVNTLVQEAIREYNKHWNHPKQDDV